jgi:hypothetical protein
MYSCSLTQFLEQSGSLSLVMAYLVIPSGKHTKNYGTSPFFMGKSTISMGYFQ